MCTERNTELCQQLIHKYISAAKIRNMNSSILSRVLSQLMRLTFQEPKVTAPVRTRSALTRITGGNRTRASSWLKIRKISKAKPKRLRRDKLFCPLPIQKRRISCRNAVKKVSDKLHNATPKSESKKEKVPIVYVQDVLTTQGRTSKSDFMEYFGLQVINNAPTPKSSKYFSNLGLIKFSQAVNIPLSSDIGLMMAARENQVLSEDFKLRKIDRCEWYVNRPYVAKEDTFDYPITYVHKNENVKKSPSNREETSSTLNAQKMLDLKKSCRTVSVKVIRLDLLKIQKTMARNTKRRINYLKKKMSEKSEHLKVLVTASEKRSVDKLTKKNDFI